MKNKPATPLEQLANIHTEFNNSLARFSKRRPWLNLLGESYQETLDRYKKENRIPKIKQYLEKYDNSPWPLRVSRKITVDIFIERKRKVYILYELKEKQSQISSMIQNQEHSTLTPENTKAVKEIRNTLSHYQKKISYFSTLQRPLANIIAKLNDWLTTHDKTEKNPPKSDVPTKGLEEKLETNEPRDEKSEVIKSLADQARDDMKELQEDYQEIKTRIEKKNLGPSDCKQLKIKIEEHNQKYRNLLLKYHPDKSNISYSQEEEKALCEKATRDLISQKKIWQAELKKINMSIIESMNSWEKINKDNEQQPKNSEDLQKHLQEIQKLFEEEAEAWKELHNKRDALDKRLEKSEQDLEKLREMMIPEFLKNNLNQTNHKKPPSLPSSHPRISNGKDERPTDLSEESEYSNSEQSTHSL